MSFNLDFDDDEEEKVEAPKPKPKVERAPRVYKRKPTITIPKIPKNIVLSWEIIYQSNLVRYRSIRANSLSAHLEMINDFINENK